MTDLVIYSPAGVVADSRAIGRARSRLSKLGFQVQVDPGARARHQRFAGTDDQRLAALHRVAQAAPSIAMATRGGYGLTRLLDHIDWPLVEASVARGTRWVGHSDLTALQIGLLTHARSTLHAVTWAGPMATYDFGQAAEEHGEPGHDGMDEITRDSFVEAMQGVLEAVGFRTEAGFDGLEARGPLWGGNLCMVMSLLGTRHWPRASRIRGGVLFLEDVNEHPYRVERDLLQLHQAGVLASQSAVLLGSFDAWRASPLDRGYGLKAMVQHLRSVTRTPILTGLPFGHVPTKLSLPVGRRVTLVVQGRDALIHWG
jgi:muramoyltetrapeptide carboxypeptidase